MPRLVVPILVPRALADSRWASSSRWRERMSGNVFGDLQVGWRHLDTLGADGLDLLDKMVGIEHHAVADHRELARTDDAGGKQRELEHLAVDHQRMAGVMAALETNDDVGGERQPVDDLPLSFVAPLGADNNDIGHRGSLSLFLKRKTPTPATISWSRGLLRKLPSRSGRRSKGAKAPQTPAHAAGEKRSGAVLERPQPIAICAARPQGPNRRVT